MPAVSEKQRKMMGADLARAKKGMKTRTGMSMMQLQEFAKKKSKSKKKVSKSDKENKADLTAPGENKEPGEKKAKRSYVRKNFKSMKQWAKKSK